jgi:hypothetical protein
MSYARFGNGSDVYVFTSSRALECCGCILQHREWVDDPSHAFLKGYFKAVGTIIQTEFDSNEGMIAHLEQHVAAGHDVPDYTFERLRDPADAAENKAIWEKYKGERDDGPTGMDAGKGLDSGDDRPDGEAG